MFFSYLTEVRSFTLNSDLNVDILETVQARLYSVNRNILRTIDEVPASRDLVEVVQRLISLTEDRKRFKLIIKFINLMLHIF